MKADGTPETEFEEAMPLFGAIIEANVRGLQRTNDQLLASRERDLLYMQNQFTMLYASMEKVFERTDSATARDAMDRFWTLNEDAKKALAKTPETY